MITKIRFILIAFIFTSALFGYTFDEKSVYSTPIKTALYPNASVAILLDSTEMKLNSDNSSSTTHHFIKKILSYKGKKENSEFKIYYNKNFEKVELIKAATIKNNTLEKIDVNKENIQDIDSPYDSGKMEYAVSRLLLVAFPSVEEGDIIEIEYKVISSSTEKFTSSVIFADYEPVYRKYVACEYPESMKPEIKTYNWNQKITTSSSITAGAVKLSFYGESLNHIISEEGMPDLSYFQPLLTFSTYKDWNEYKNKILPKFLEKIKATEKLTSFAAMLTKNCKSDEERVSVIKDFIAKNINDIGTINMVYFDFRDPEKVLESGYASSFDKTTLFLSLLKSVGINGTPVVVGQKSVLFNPQKPVNASAFNYVISLVRLKDRELFINPVSEFFPLGYINYDSVKGFLVKEGNIEFVTVSSDNVNKTVKKDLLNISISNNGTSECNSKGIESGSYAVNFNSNYKYMNETDKKIDYQKKLSSISQSAEPISENITINLGVPASYEFSFRQKNFASIDGNFFYYDVPENIVPFSLSTEPDNRKYPYQRLDSNEINSSVVIKYPEGYELLIYPDSISISTSLFDITRTVVLGKNSYEINDKIVYKPAIISAAEYKNIFEIIKKLSHQKFSKILMKIK